MASNSLIAILTMRIRRISMKTIFRESKRVLKDKREVKETKKRKRKGTSSPMKNKKTIMIDNKETRKWMKCSRIKPQKVVTKRKTTMKMQNSAIMKKKESFNNSMPERGLVNRKLFWGDYKENHRMKSTRCIKENFIKGGKMKSCFLRHKTIKHTLSNASKENKTRLCFLYWKKPNIIERLKTKNSELISLQQWQWRKNTQEEFLSKLLTKKLSGKVLKAWLMLI